MTAPRTIAIGTLALVVASARLVTAGEGAIKGVVTSGQAKTPVVGAVVMIDGPSHAAAPGTRATIDQKNDTFVPHVLAIAVGTTVEFPNRDPRLHNVYSASRPNQFDLGMYGEGETKSTMFESPGVVRVLCNVHPKMEAFIFVHRNPYLAVTDAEGRYTITGVPPGKHDLRTWHEKLGEKRDRVEVFDGQTAPFDVRLTAP